MAQALGYLREWSGAKVSANHNPYFCGPVGYGISLTPSDKDSGFIPGRTTHSTGCEE
jgi:hypothetical protein